jgi:uncharacterized integral membrane protein
MHGEFLLLLFLQAHRETGDKFSFIGSPAQSDQDQFCFHHAAFCSSLKSKVGLVAAKAAARRCSLWIWGFLFFGLFCIFAQRAARQNRRAKSVLLFLWETELPLGNGACEMGNGASVAVKLSSDQGRDDSTDA